MPYVRKPKPDDIIRAGDIMRERRWKTDNTSVGSMWPYFETSSITIVLVMSITESSGLLCVMGLRGKEKVFTLCISKLQPKAGLITGG